MHDQEVAGQIELLDQGELVLELRAHARRERVAVALARTQVGELVKKGGLALARWNRELGKAVAEIAEPEGAAFSHAAGRADPFGMIGEARRHFFAPLEGSLAVGEQQTPGGVESRLLAQTREGVEQRTVGRLCTADIAACDHGHSSGLRQRDGAARGGLRAAFEVARHVDPESLAAEHGLRAIES